MAGVATGARSAAVRLAVGSPTTGAAGPSGTSKPPQKGTAYDYGTGTTTSKPMTGLYVKGDNGKPVNVTKQMRQGASFPGSPVSIYSNGRKTGTYNQTSRLV